MQPTKRLLDATPTNVEAPVQVKHEQKLSKEHIVLVPVAAVFLPVLAYTNLWLMNAVPQLDQIEQTLPRVILIALTLAYLAIIWVVGSSPKRATRNRSRLWRSTLVLGIIAVNVLVPATLLIQDRIQRGTNPDNVIDWPLQIEAGSQLLLQGQSPYGVDYSHTEMQEWSEEAGFPSNPALRHAIHLPVNFLLGVLTMPVWQQIMGWYDARILLISAYLFVVLAAPSLTKDWEDGHLLQIGLALNPPLVETFMGGLSDYLLLAWLVAMLLLRQRGKYHAAAALLGIAVATRQFSWVLVPIYLSAEWFAVSSSNVRQKTENVLRRVWPLLLIPAVLILPFFLANPRGFYDDVIAFGSGGIEDAYPIGGPQTYGLSVVMLALGWAKSQTSQFPFGQIQLIATLPVLCYAVWSQRANNTLRRMLLSYAVVLGVFLFTGRFMHTNYVGFLFAIVTLACFTADTAFQTSLSHQEQRTRSIG